MFINNFLMSNRSNSSKTPEQQAVVAILIAISFCHLINDMLQSLIFAIYPILKNSFSLSFTQIGLIGFVYQCTASLLQPIVGQYTDRNHKPYSLVVGMSCTLIGLLLLAFSSNFFAILIAVSIIGTGSSIFHPEASRIARMAGRGRHGIAQSFFQVGGNFGTAIGPLLAAFIILPQGQETIAWFCIAAFFGMVLLSHIGSWYKKAHLANKAKAKQQIPSQVLPKNVVIFSLFILVALIFSKFFYQESIKSYYTFYLIHTFNVSIQTAQILLFSFLLANVIGVLLGGILGDKYGRKLIIWFSILGSLPFTLALPYCNLIWTEIFIFIIGLIMSSAFSAILVYAQELIPGRVGMISGLFFGIGFGFAGIAAALLGKIADISGISFVYQICSFLPIIGLLTYFLPDVEKRKF